MRAVVGAALLGLASGAAAPASATVPPDATAQPAPAHPDIWPRYRHPATLTDAQDARVSALLARMTLSSKLCQLVPCSQIGRAHVSTPVPTSPLFCRLLLE